MDGVKDQVNWSEIARGAFENKLAEIDRTKGTTVNQDLIERLRKDKAQLDSNEYQGGWKCGQLWANHHASVRDFRCMERFAADANWSEPVDNAYTFSEVAYGGIFEDMNRNGAAEFWSFAAGGDETPVAEFIHGFFDGALEIWNQAKDLL